MAVYYLVRESPLPEGGYQAEHWDDRSAWTGFLWLGEPATNVDDAKRSADERAGYDLDWDDPTLDCDGDVVAVAYEQDDWLTGWTWKPCGIAGLYEGIE